jgi:hypothetical protein
MRKLYEATGGQPQRWESLGNLRAVKVDAAGIAYAIEKDWLVISGGLHSASLTRGRSPAVEVAATTWEYVDRQPGRRAFDRYMPLPPKRCIISS